MNQYSNYTFSHTFTRNGPNSCESGCVDTTCTSPATEDEEHANGQVMHENSRQLVVCKDKENQQLELLNWGKRAGRTKEMRGRKRTLGSSLIQKGLTSSSSGGSLFCLGRVPKKGKGLIRPGLKYLRHKSLLL